MYGQIFLAVPEVMWDTRSSTVATCGFIGVPDSDVCKEMCIL